VIAPVIAKTRKKAADNPPAAAQSTTVGSVSASGSVSLDGTDKPEQDQRDASLPSPERESNAQSTDNQKAETLEQKMPEESPQILQASVKKEVQLKNLDSWAHLSDIPTTSGTEPQKKDETWSQFQNRDIQNKMREKRTRRTTRARKT